MGAQASSAAPQVPRVLIWVPRVSILRPGKATQPARPLRVYALHHATRTGPPPAMRMFPFPYLQLLPPAFSSSDGRRVPAIRVGSGAGSAGGPGKFFALPDCTMICAPFKTRSLRFEWETTTAGGPGPGSSVPTKNEGAHGPSHLGTVDRYKSQPARKRPAHPASVPGNRPGFRRSTLPNSRRVARVQGS